MATVVSITNPITGAVEQVDKLDHTAQQIDDAVALAPQLSNPNLLDNWYFRSPVNQRGQTSYTGAGYGIDRWKSLGASVVTVNDGSVTFTSGATIPTGCHMAQYLENYSDLSGITVTLSVLVKDISGKFVFFIGGTRVGTIQEPGLYFWTTQKDTSEIAVKFYNENEGSAFIELTAVKLELGSQQTLAHQDENGVWQLNEIPDYGEQLRRCQYFNVKDIHQTIVGGLNYAGNSLTIPVKFPRKMRSVPSIKIKQVTVIGWGDIPIDKVEPYWREEYGVFVLISDVSTYGSQAGKSAVVTYEATADL